MSATIYRLVIILSVLALLASCAGARAAREAKFLEKELVKGAKSTPERSVKDDISTTGKPIQVITISFLTDQPVFEYRDWANKLLLDRGYSQALNLSTPNEFSMAYNGLKGYIHVQILAEVAMPPASQMTELPPEAQEKPQEPSAGPTSPPQPPVPPQGEGKGAEGNQTEPPKSAEPAKPQEPPTPTNIHKITIKISY